MPARRCGSAWANKANFIALTSSEYRPYEKVLASGHRFAYDCAISRDRC